jgi:hypothetical protein
MVRTDKAEAISDQSQQIINGTFNTDVIAEGGFYDAMAGKTLAQQEDIVQGMVTKLAEDHPKKALELIESYETGVIALGNGVVRDEFADSLENAFANEEKRVDLIAKGVETKRNDSIAEFQAVYSNAIALGQDIPESTDIFINDGLTITVDTSNAKNAADVANAVKDAVNNIPENDKTISNGTKALIINKFAGEVEKQKLNVVQQRENAGVNVASSQFMDLLAVQDSEGNYIYGEGMETTLGRASQTQEWVEELNPIIDAIYADPELDISQKVQQSKMATLKFVAEKKESHDQFVKEKEDAIKSIEAEKRTGGDQERFYVADVFTQVAKEKGDLEAMKQRPEIVEKAREFNAETERLRDEILNRSMTDEEIASGMTNAEFTLKKDEEMRALNVDRRALYQQDYGVDEEIDGVTSEKQIPKEVLKDQESINRGSETANVVIKESSGAGLAPTNFSIKNLDPDKPVDYGLQYGGDAVKSNPQTFRAINSTNLVEDINTPKSMGSEFKIGLFDNLRLSWITRNLPQEIDTIHKANQVRAIKFQEEGANYMDTEKGQSIVAEFVSGETMTRVVRDGKAGITVDELESGDLEGVAFNATALNQSATPILPFGLLNKAFLDSDNLTPQEEQQVRDYADALYDTSELDDKGRKVIINKMVELQVNAYTIIGFEFAK